MKEYIVTSEQLDRVNALLMAVKQTKLDFGGMPELVRCRDCRWFEPECEYYENHGNGAIETLGEPPSCNKFNHSLDGDCGYCAWG